MATNEKTGDRREADEPAPEGKGRRPYRAPQVVTRPLFERMALGCIDPQLGNPY